MQIPERAAAGMPFAVSLRAENACEGSAFVEIAPKVSRYEASVRVVTVVIAANGAIVHATTAWGMLTH